MRIESAHFEVFTDLDAADGDATARELEDVFAALSLAFEGARVPTERTEVVVFRDEDEFHAFVPGHQNGAFYEHWRNDPEGPRLLLAYGQLDTAGRASFLHELTHELVYSSFPATPTWLQEGWAEYYSSVRVEGDTVVIGERARVFSFRDIPRYYGYLSDSRAPGLAIPFAARRGLSSISHRRVHPDPACRLRRSGRKLANDFASPVGCGGTPALGDAHPLRRLEG